MLYELILINEIEQRAKIIFLSVWVLKQNENGLLCDSSEHFRGYIYIYIYIYSGAWVMWNFLFVCLFNGFKLNLGLYELNYKP